MLRPGQEVRRGRECRNERDQLATHSPGSSRVRLVEQTPRVYLGSPLAAQQCLQPAAWRHWVASGQPTLFQPVAQTFYRTGAQLAAVTKAPVLNGRHGRARLHWSNTGASGEAVVRVIAVPCRVVGLRWCWVCVRKRGGGPHDSTCPWARRRHADRPTASTTVASSSGRRKGRSPGTDPARPALARHRPSWVAVYRTNRRAYAAGVRAAGGGNPCGGGSGAGQNRPGNQTRQQRRAVMIKAVLEHRGLA